MNGVGLLGSKNTAHQDNNTIVDNLKLGLSRLLNISQAEAPPQRTERFFECLRKCAFPAGALAIIASMVVIGSLLVAPLGAPAAIAIGALGAGALVMVLDHYMNRDADQNQNMP